MHSGEEAGYASCHGADAVIFGNVFETSCKPGKKGAGIDVLKQIVEISKVPVFAIGGIDADNVSLLKDTGIAGVCMMSAFMGSDDPGSVVSAVKRL